MMRLASHYALPCGFDEITYYAKVSFSFEFPLGCCAWS
ncbi:hypothetical protein PRUB_b0501 [Pseudoalteromonas rubra]|uniref:Uncharacterized protein n=1 Tax=Pseudoalteromonas rubra TaxID=43658 RepID=A0A8T0BZU4_9GAMM|nr:hypothetical protein PRUB_b0501 [Pseudoalteromonas rubra]